MYCLSIGNLGTKKITEKIKDFEIAEIRLDLCDLNKSQISQIFSSHNNLIATFRKKENYSDKHRIKTLKTAIKYGAKWIDVDMESNSKEFIKSVDKIRVKYNIKLILSIHNFKETPLLTKIEEFIYKGDHLKADLIKLAFFANSDLDNTRVLSLYERHDNILAFNMGEMGKATRIKALELGAPFTYVSLPEANTAPGQMTIEEIKKIPMIDKNLKPKL